MSLVKLGDFPSAVGPFERAVKLRPGDDTMRTNLAFAYIKTGQSAKAIGHLSRAIKIDGTNVNAYLLRARAYTNTVDSSPLRQILSGSPNSRSLAPRASH
ncbi:MAG: tetratricopeptide repeat protein [Blastocatellia bacterium]|nr:tetratricopeptide repeat protein [Blastocatellia bacterium]